MVEERRLKKSLVMELIGGSMGEVALDAPVELEAKRFGVKAAAISVFLLVRMAKTFWKAFKSSPVGFKTSKASWMRLKLLGTLRKL